MVLLLRRPNPPHRARQPFANPSSPRPPAPPPPILPSPHPPLPPFRTQVLAIGGVKEKTMAARRSGITCLIFPEANKRDFEELPAYLKEGLEVHFAEEYQTVFEVAFMEEDFFTNE